MQKFLNTHIIIETIMLKLKKIKTELSTLSPEFLTTIKDIFSIDSFIETGTFEAETTLAAAGIFSEVHSVELSSFLYQKAKEKLKNIANVTLYEGDSARELPRILKNVSGKALFWLDGHFSEGNTAKGDKSTPILEEISAISESGFDDCVIMIDDMRIFEREIADNPESLKGYPSLRQLETHVKQHFPDAGFYVFADIAIVLTKDIERSFSWVVRAITRSRISCKTTGRGEEMLATERIIANAQGCERDALLDLPQDYSSSEQYGLGAHYRLWRGLVLLKSGDFDEAESEFRKASKLGMSMARLQIYLDMAAAKDASPLILDSNIDFAPEDMLLAKHVEKVGSADDLLEKMKGKKIFSDVKTLVFAGAHRFQEETLLNAIFPNLKRCVLIEPIPEIAAELRQKLSGNAKYTIIEAALTDSNGEATFNITDNDGMSSSLMPLGKHETFFPYVHKSGEITVKTMTFDSILEAAQIKSCDALLLDIQGAEHKVLTSISDKHLAEIDFIYTETSKIEIYEGSGTFDEINFWLSDFFDLAGYLPNTNDVPDHGNALYINKRIVSSVSQSQEAAQDDSREILIATSISPRGIETQQTAVNSWIEAGFKVISVNAPEEIAELKEQFPNVEFIAADRDARELTGRPLIYLDTILDALYQTGVNSCGIINSDIILRHDYSISEVIDMRENKFVFCSRQEVDHIDQTEGKIFIYGFDLFFFHRDLISKIPKSEFCLGMPWWDYWLPAAMIAAKADSFYLSDIPAFHITHKTNYDEKLWVHYAKMFSSHAAPALRVKFDEIESLDGDENEMFRLRQELAYYISVFTINHLRSKPNIVKTKTRQRVPKISVITPSFNQAKYIRQTIESVLAQDYPNFEHIIIDGGSTDGTLDILREYDHLIWKSEPDKGQSDALNKALELATGDIIAWINSDDYYEKGAFDVVESEMSADLSKEIIIGDCQFINEDGSSKLYAKNNNLELPDLLRYWDIWIPPTQPSIFFRRSLIEEHGGFDTTLSYAMDYDLWLRFASCCKFHYLPRLLAYYRLHDESKSGSGDDWSRFYPEWHELYLRYKSSCRCMPSSPLLTVAIALSHRDFFKHDFLNMLNRTVQAVRSQIFRDAEILIIHDMEDTKELPNFEKHDIDVRFVTVAELDEGSFFRAIAREARGHYLHAISISAPVHPHIYSQSISMLLDNPDSSSISIKSDFDTEHTFLNQKSLLHPEIIITAAKFKEELFSISAREEINQLASRDIVFSVIIPTYRRAKTLRKCLEALNKQTFDSSKFEVIVIDDGSGDDTSQIVKQYKSTYKLKYIYQQNAGPAAARNKGILDAKGKFVLIINDDTIADAKLIEEHFNAQQAAAGRKLAVLGSFDYIDEALKKPFTYYLHHKPLIFAYSTMQSGKVYPYRYFWSCNISIDRIAFNEAGLFDENFTEPMVEDTEMGYRLQQCGWQVLFYKQAKAIHDHWLTVEGFARRQRMSGRNMLKVFRKHPDLLREEQQLFGFKDLDEPTLASFRKYIKSNKESANHSIELIKKLESITITNPDSIEVRPGVKFTGADLIDFIDSHIWYVHYVNFFTGILEGIENENKKAQHKETTQFITNAKQKKPRIMLTMFGWNEAGGGTIFPKAVAKRFAERGYDVAVFYAAMDHPSSDKAYFMDRTMDSGVKLFGVFNRKYPRIMIDQPELEVNDPAVVKLFKEAMEEFTPDVVHFFNFLGLSFELAKVAHDAGKRTVFSPENYHLIDPELYMIKPNLENWKNTNIFENSQYVKDNPTKAAAFSARIEAAKRLLNEYLDITISISSRVREILIDFGGDHDKINVVHQVPPAHEFLDRGRINHAPPSRKLRVGFIGTVSPIKGVHKLVAAMQIIGANRAECSIFGEGVEQYIAELKKMDRSGSCTFHGKYTYDDLPRIASQLDVIVIPSVWEECAGLVIPEALAMGLPVVVARIGGMPEFIVEGINGTSYPHDSERNLAAILQCLASESSTLEELTENAGVHRSFNDYINLTTRLYDKLLSGKYFRVREFDFRM